MAIVSLLFLVSAYPTTQGVIPQGSGNGAWDGLTTNVTMGSAAPIANAGEDQTIDQHQEATFNGSGSHDDDRIVNFTWAFTYQHRQILLYGPIASFVFDDAGKYEVLLTVTDLEDQDGVDAMNVTVRDITPPSANAGPDVIIDQHETVDLDGSLSTDNYGIANYSWVIKMWGYYITTCYGPSTNYTFHTVGNYTISLTVTDFGGQMATDTSNVTVRDITPPQANAGPDVTIDQNEVMYFDGSWSRDNVRVVNWTWRFRDWGRTVELFGRCPTYKFYNAGVYVVELNVTDSSGFWAIDVMNVTVRDTVTPWIPERPVYYVNQHDVLTFNSTSFWDNVGIINLTWSFRYEGQNVTLYGPAPSFRFEIAGSYKVYIEAMDAVGNIGKNIVYINVNDTTPPVAMAGEDVGLLQGENARFVDDGSTDNVGVRNWTWRFLYGGTPVELYGETVEFRFELAGIFLVNLTVRDMAGNNATDALLVIVRDTAPPCADAGEVGWADQHELVTLNGTGSSDNVGVVNWTWMFDYYGTPIVLFGPSPSFRFDDAGTYTVTLIVIDAEGGSGTDTVNVTVHDTMPPTAYCGSDITADQGVEFVLDGRGSIDNVAVTSWTWRYEYRGAPQRLTGMTCTIVLNSPGTYDFTLVVADAEGNTNSTVLRVRVRDTVTPSAITQGDIVARTNERVQFDGSLSADNVGIVSWVWTFHDGGRDIRLEGMLASHVFKDRGANKVTLNVTDADGNTASETFTVTVEADLLPLLLLLVVVVVIVVLAIVAFVVMRKRKKPIIS